MFAVSVCSKDRAKIIANYKKIINYLSARKWNIFKLRFPKSHSIFEFKMHVACNRMGHRL